MCNSRGKGDGRGPRLLGGLFMQIALRRTGDVIICTLTRR